MPALRLTQAQSGQTVRLRPGDEFVIEVNENPTTGYHWEIDSGDAGVIRLLDSRHRSQSQAPGAGGIREFHFLAAEPGQAELRLKLWRPWEGEQSVNSRFTVTLQVN